MGWLERWRWHRAAKAYGAQLGPALAAAYGGEPPYTAGQVEAAVRRLRLNPRFVALGYAAFLDQTEYAKLKAASPGLLEREVARLLFERYKPWAHLAEDDDWGDPLNSGGIGASRGVRT